MIVYRARWVVPITSAPIEHGTVAVRDGRIAYVGPRDGAPAADDVRDLGDAALLPGLVNAHTHLELTVMRGFLEELPFVEWIGTLTRARREVLDDAALLDSSRLGIREGLLAGVTTFADTGFSGTPMRAMVEAGVRGIAFQEVFGPAPEQRAEALAGLQAAVARLRAIETPLVRVGVSPHAVYSVHEDLIVDSCAWAVGEGLPIAMHLAESREEMEFLREARGPFAESHRARGIEVVRRSHSPVHLLVELGVTTIARPLLIHCVQLDESDVHFIARDGCPVAHCPASNAKLGHGTAPLVELLDAGAIVGLGSDSVASNNRMDLLDEARLAVLAQRARLRRHDALPAAAALELATLGGARALGLADRVGSLEVGKEADLAAFPLDGPRGNGAGDVVATLVHALAGRAASLVAVAGRELVRGGRGGLSRISFRRFPHPTPMSSRSSGRTTVIWRDGQLVPWEDATLHVMSHVVHYGSSVFEGIRCYETPGGPAIFRLREHMRRLVDSSKIYRMPVRWSVDELVQAAIDTVGANELRHCYLRPLVIRTGEQMGVYGMEVPVEVFVIAWKWGAYLGQEALDKGVDVAVSSWRRAAPSTFPTMAKAGGNYLNSQLAKMEARTDGYVEAITLDSFGFISEGSGENLFVIRDGVIHTSPASAGILHGITRDSVVQIARDLGYEVREQTLPRELLYVADECFFTGTAAEITPIRSVDRIPVGEGRPGPITREIQERFLGIARGQIADPYGWLTPVPLPAPVA